MEGLKPTLRSEVKGNFGKFSFKLRVLVIWCAGAGVGMYRLEHEGWQKTRSRNMDKDGIRAAMFLVVALSHNTYIYHTLFHSYKRNRRDNILSTFDKHLVPTIPAPAAA